MHRFFIGKESIQAGIAVIRGEDAGHIQRVLRLQQGDKICLCDGMGREYTAQISKADKQAVYAEIISERKSDTESAFRVTLYQALPKAGKMELILQKCVELGVAAINPVVTERCVVKQMGGGEFEKKRERYQRIVYEAAKQSGRGIVPEVRPLAELKDCSFETHDLVLFAYEGEHDVRLKQVLRGTAAKEIALVIGPEGGFAEEEAAWLAQRGAKTVSLGNRILRTETAGMAMLAMVVYELEL